MVDVGDMEAMAAAVAELARNQGMLESIGRAAHETTRQFSIERYCAKFVEMLDFVGAGRLDDLFSHIPEEILFHEPPSLPQELEYGGS